MDLQNGDEWRVEARNNYEYLDEPFEIADGLFLPVGGYRFNEVEGRYTIGAAAEGQRHRVGRRRRSSSTARARRSGIAAGSR